MLKTSVILLLLVAMSDVEAQDFPTEHRGAPDTSGYRLVRGHIADWTFFITLDSTDESAWFKRGYYRQKVRDFAGAIADYSEALRLSPGFEDGYMNRGYAKFETGDNPGA